MTPDAVEIFKRTMVMLERRRCSDGDALMLTAMYVSYVRQRMARIDPTAPRAEVEAQILEASYHADSLIALPVDG